MVLRSFDFNPPKKRIQKSTAALLCMLLFITLGCAQDSDSDQLVEDTLDEPAKPFQDVTNTHLFSGSTGNNSMDAAVVDIDDDGDLDIVLAMEFVANAILINDGTGKLTDESQQRFPNLQHDSEDIAIADFDSDGDLDIVFVSEDDQTNEFYENTGNGSFIDSGSRIPVTGTTNAVESVDINNDGHVDLILGNAGQNFILINDGTGNFDDESSTRLPSNNFTTQDIELADVDNDNDLDIVEANETFNRILINNGDGVFSDETSTNLPAVNDQTREVDLGDIDNDGDLDIVFANVDFGGFGDPQNRLLENDGSGKFSEITENLPQSDFRTVDIDFFDIDGDGFLDLLSGNRWNGVSNLVLINDGTGLFSDQTIDFFPSLNMYVFDFQVADFNKDGIDDIYLCGFSGVDKLLFRAADE